MTSPTQRCLAECRARGWTVQVVERWNPHARVRQDLFGFADLLCLTPDGIVAIQVTSGTNHAARRAKILAEPRARSWLGAGARLEVWSYSKRGARGKVKRWTLRTEPVVIADFGAAA